MMDGNLPKISVVMPAYNAQRYIADAIRSVQGQTYSNWELLVIDDHSRDDTCQIVRALAAEDPRIRLYENRENLGTARTRNRGMELCTGEYVALLDSDDLWRPEKLEKQYQLAVAEKADLIYTAYGMVDEDGTPRYNDFFVPPYTDFASMLKENVIGCSTVLMTADVARQFRFSTAFYHEDYALWLQLLQAGKKTVGVGTVCADYRVHANGRASDKMHCAKCRWRIYRSGLNLSLPRSMYYLACYARNGLKKYGWKPRK